MFCFFYLFFYRPIKKVFGHRYPSFEFDFNFIEEEEDDDDNDLVQMLKDKFSVKRIEPTLDEILDKINQKGVISLSVQEQAILKSYN